YALGQPKDPRQVAAENVLLILLAQACHVLDAGRSVGERRRRMRVVAANDEVLATNRLDCLRQTELVWLHRDIKRLPQELAGPGAAARTLTLDPVYPVKGVVYPGQPRATRLEVAELEVGELFEKAAKREAGAAHHAFEGKAQVVADV